jgi:hypothetical protein
MLFPHIYREGVFSAGFGAFHASHAPLTPERVGAALAGNRRERALIVAVGASIAYPLVVVAVVFTAAELLASVLIGGVGGVLGVAAGIGGAAYSRSES